MQQERARELYEAFHTVFTNKYAFYLPGVFVGILFRSAAPWVWLRIALELPGTIAHEFCHLIVALVLNAKPSGFTVIPTKGVNGWVLGSVTLNNTRWYNALLCGLAPLLLVPLFYPWIPANWAVLPPNIENIKVWALMAIILPSAIPSTTDLKVGFMATLLPVALFVGICYCLARSAG